MVLKTFNVDGKAYEEFSKHCKKNGISMSRRVENFIKEEMEKIKSESIERTEMPETPKPEKIQKIENELHPLSKYC
ncbi:MAG: hypothetical protein MUF61_01040 [archaeon]|jgi:hypothetical protein|nr:hypothetical protein [archaeon]